MIIATSFTKSLSDKFDQIILRMAVLNFESVHLGKKRIFDPITPYRQVAVSKVVQDYLE